MVYGIHDEHVLVRVIKRACFFTVKTPLFLADEIVRPRKSEKIKINVVRLSGEKVKGSSSPFK